jgi:hypothetical protein
VGRGAKETQHVRSLRTAITDRLGKRVEVVEVVRPDDSEYVLVRIRLPEMPLPELLALQEWVQAELRVVAAEHGDDLVIVPLYVVGAP